jgi:hypothetical protein
MNILKLARLVTSFLAGRPRAHFKKVNSGQVESRPLLCRVALAFMILKTGDV